MGSYRLFVRDALDLGNEERAGHVLLLSGFVLQVRYLLVRRRTRLSESGHRRCGSGKANSNGLAENIGFSRGDVVAGWVLTILRGIVSDFRF